MNADGQRPRLAGKRATMLVAAVLALPPAPALSAATWNIDPARTRIAFAIDAVGFPRTQGTFHRFEGRIAVDFAEPERSSVAFHVLSQSADVGSPSFSDYLRSDAFLNAARFPAIDFVSTAVTKISESAVRVTGDLTLVGVTLPLTIDVAVKRVTTDGHPRLAFAAEARINRLAYGMNAGFPVVSKDVDFEISTEASEP